MNRIRLLTAACALAALVGLASLNSAQAQGGKTATLKGKVTYNGNPPARAFRRIGSAAAALR